MRIRAEDLLGSMKGADPDLEWALLRRVRALAPNRRALCFGRIESDGGDPMGLVRRRQFVVDGAQLLSIGDDTFGEAGRRPEGGGLRGRDALLVELERARSGEMIDIVATIQPEQDQVIRSDAVGVLAVQGGPGSGKTAVGLHRAAFLLYGDDAMARANILVVGPNRTFLRYIAQVLPSLGEDAVVQSTLVDLVPEVERGGAGDDQPDVERIKGDGRMATVLRQALAARRGHHPDDLVVLLGVRRLSVAAAVVNADVDRIAARPLPYAAGRDVLRGQLLTLVAARFEELTGAPPPDGAAFERAVRNEAGVKSALDLRWPSVPPATLVADLLGRPAALAAAADGVLTPEEQRLLRRRRARAWTKSDAALVDEAKDLIAGQSRVYGHVIVDEAQDLSPMQLRMLARRCPSGSMTLLGDLAQAVGVWGHRDWDDLGNGLGAPVRVVELRLGYRSPSQVLELANRLLAEAAPDVTPTEAVRPGRSEPRRIAAGPGELPAAITAEVAALADVWATVAVIVPALSVADVVAALRLRLGSAVGDVTVDGLSRKVTVIAAEGAKGLEFHAVVVGEPEAIIAERTDRPTGLRLLYVALTRPTQHLSIVSSTPLPAALTPSVVAEGGWAGGPATRRGR